MRRSPAHRTNTPPRTRADVAFCYGTRPQVIKAARITPALRARWTVVTVDTGQHFDYALNEGLYHDLAIQPPSAFLDEGAAHPVDQTSRMAAACSRVLAEHKPRVVVVIGDTNSTLGCAIAAVDLGIPLVHVEAGLRSGVPDMAEERIRIAVDGMSRVLCAPSRAAVDNLAREHVTGTVVQTGDVSRDVLLAALATRSDARVSELPTGAYVLATLHRAELTDDRERLAAALVALGHLELPVILPAHPRTVRRISEFGLESKIPAEVRLLPPFGYLQNIAAIQKAAVVVTDSGGVQREAYWLGTPCVTLRGETEWDETVALGANRLVDPARCEAELAVAVAAARTARGHWNRDAYGDGAAADAIADAVAPLVARADRARRPLVSR